MKMDEKTHILAWKEEEVSSEEIVKRMGRHRLLIDHLVARSKNFPQAHHASPQKGLCTFQKEGHEPEDDPEEIGLEVFHDGCHRGANKRGRIVGGLQADYTANPADRSENAKPSGGHKAAADGDNESQKDQICPGLPSLHCRGLVQSHVLDESMFKCIKASRYKVRRPEGVSWYESKHTVMSRQ